MGIGSGNISIKSAAGSGQSIDAEVASVSSGSLVTLSTNAVAYNSVTSAPYGMREFAGYTHTQTMTMTETQYARNASAGHMYDAVRSDSFQLGFSSLSSGFEHRFLGSTSGGKYNILWSIRESNAGLGNYYPASGSYQTGSHTAWKSVANYRFDSPTSAPTTIRLNASTQNNSWGSGGLGTTKTELNGYAGAGRDLNPAGTSVNWNDSYMSYERIWESGAECSSYYFELYDTFSLTFGRTGYYSLTGTSFKTYHDHTHSQYGLC